MKAEKFQAKKYRKSLFLPNLLLHLLAGLACSLVSFNIFWLPSLCSTMKNFLIISLPCMWSSFFSNPKYLFIVVNVIVIFLVGESWLLGPSSSPTRDIHYEYMERSRSLQGVSVFSHLERTRQPQKKRVEEVENEAELKVVNTNEDKEVNSKEENEELVEMMKEQKFGGREEKEEVEVKEVIRSDVNEAKTFQTVDEEEAYEEKGEIVEEEVGIPTEELNKRVEEFIARVNKQRWLEAQLLVCCKP